MKTAAITTAELPELKMSKDEMDKYLEGLEKKHQRTITRYPKEQSKILPVFPRFNFLVIDTGFPIREEDIVL